MSLKITILIITMVCLGTFSPGAIAQSYENMPVEVQKKMSDNKASGLPLKTGVWVDYELTIEGVTDDKTAAGFEAFLKAECGLQAFHFDPATRHVSYTVPAEYDLDGMAVKLKSTRFSIGLFFKELYHL